MSRSDEPGFWEERYRAGRMPWDAGGVPVALQRFLAADLTRGRVLIPGCGSGYEVAAFVAAGWIVDAIDFSPAAVARARQSLGPHGACVREGDFFAEPGPARCDLIYERTFLCSLPPERWPEYAARMAALLRPGGRLVGLFYYGVEPEPPPYPLTDGSARAQLGEAFERVESRPVPAAQSLPLYAGAERWEIWRRRPA
ncbi:MAG: methyltransferase domain-containing protein [Opitutaceae bacterium]|nr:methyltransferase domain-containing protein [Opitutaceae bacterium]